MEPQEGALPRLTRESAATDAGLSEHQRKTALRVAAIPEPEFTAAVEPDVQSLIRGEVSAAGRVGRPASGNVRNTHVSGGGEPDTATRALRRLKRDNPELAEQVVAGGGGRT